MSETDDVVAAPPVGSEDEAAYGTALEEAFIAERGTPFLLSSKDWQIVRSWLERGIPKDTAIRAIQETFEKRRARGAVGKISSIAYCANAVEERWELERRGLVGKNEGLETVEVGSIPDRLLALISALEACEPPPDVDPDGFRKGVARAIEKIRGLGSGLGFDQTEEALADVESALLRKVRKAFDAISAEELTKRVDEALGPPDVVSTPVREKTRKALERRETRRMASLPPLTLFDV